MASEKMLYRIAVDCNGDHHEAGRLWDEPVQRSIANGEMEDSRVNSRYGGYVQTETVIVGDDVL